MAMERPSVAAWLLPRVGLRQQTLCYPEDTQKHGLSQPAGLRVLAAGMIGAEQDRQAVG